MAGLLRRTVAGTAEKAFRLSTGSRHARAVAAELECKSHHLEPNIKARGRGDRVLYAAAPALVLALGASPVPSSELTTFGDIEYVIGGDRALEAEQELAERLAPPGARVADVRVQLHKAGADYVATSRNGEMRFLYSGRETYLTISVAIDGTVVRSIALTRQTLGG